MQAVREGGANNSKSERNLKKNEKKFLTNEERCANITQLSAKRTCEKTKREKKFEKT